MKNPCLTAVWFTQPDKLEALLTEHHNIIVRRRKTDLKDVTSFAARWNEQAWRIAVCLHAGEHGRQAAEISLSHETAEAAIEIADWFAEQQLNLLNAGRESARRERWKGVLLFADAKTEFTARELYREISLARDAQDAKHLLAAMVEAGQLDPRDRDTNGGGGRLAVYYSLPK